MTLIVMTSNLGVDAAELAFGRQGADPRQAASASAPTSVPSSSTDSTT